MPWGADEHGGVEEEVLSKRRAARRQQIVQGAPLGFGRRDASLDSLLQWNEGFAAAGACSRASCRAQLPPQQLDLRPQLLVLGRESGGVQHLLCAVIGAAGHRNYTRQKNSQRQGHEHWSDR